MTPSLNDLIATAAKSKILYASAEMAVNHATKQYEDAKAQYERACTAISVWANDAILTEMSKQTPTVVVGEVGRLIETKSDARPQTEIAS